MRAIKAGSEAAFQMQVEGLATFHGWDWFHAPDNRPIEAKSGRKYVQNVKAGFPDLVLTRGTEIIVAELKTEKGRLSKQQDAWLERFQKFAAAIDDLVKALAATPSVEAVNGIPVFEVRIWRPSMLQEIERRLSRPSIGVPGDEFDQHGVCPNCESTNVLVVRRSDTLERLGFKCGACACVWTGIRRRLAA